LFHASEIGGLNIFMKYIAGYIKVKMASCPGIRRDK
jgi:hypothetical protein